MGNMAKLGLASRICFLTLFLGTFLNNIEPLFGAKPIVIDNLYASSLYRNGRLLSNVSEVARFDGLDALHKCLMHCLQLKNVCKSFNYAENGTCILLGESLCADDTFELVEDEDFSYFDLMAHPDYERKHLSDEYCRVYGKCSGQCYPRKPQVVEEAMTREEAFRYCASIQRKLAQPKSQSENQFYGDFSRKISVAFKQNVNGSKISNVDRIVVPPITKGSVLEKQFKDAKFWIGVTDTEMEGFWLYDDGNAVSEQFSAWAVSQPDNGGGAIGAKTENCAAIEARDYNWFDVQCEQKLHFFCA